MNRLTFKDKRTKNGIRLPSYCNKYQEQVFTKLSQLEDLEKELGIDLLTLFKALKQDYIYYKRHYRWDDRYKINKEYIQGLKYADDNTPVFWTNDCGEEHMVYIKDYGKTWALTREELEHNE